MTAGVAAIGCAESGMTAAPYVDVHETHTGVVVLVGHRAYKAKKPVLAWTPLGRSSAPRKRHTPFGVEPATRPAYG